MPICAACGKPITGPSITALDKSWHPEHFVCAHCGVAFGRAGFYVRDGKPYCQADYDERFGPCCAVNGHPIGRARCLVKDGLLYCEPHYWQRFGQRCAIGGEFLAGRHLLNTWGDVYCQAHAAGLPTCSSCGRPVCQGLTGGGLRYGDGRVTCGICRRTAVDDPCAGQKLLAQVAAGLAHYGLTRSDIPISLRLVDQGELNRHGVHTYAKQPSGIASYHVVTRGSQVIERVVDGILILHGLPAEHFTAIAAHELMHIHLFVHDFGELPDEVSEGLCELAEALWLLGHKTPAAATRLHQMAQNRSAVYGQGYQRARAALTRMTLPKLLAFVREHRQWP